jgi:HD superfamily phosphohydrolase
VKLKKETSRIEVIRDPIYGYVGPLTKDYIDIINLEAFQRLRRIKQLSFIEITYPDGTHTRFSHSLGAMKLAEEQPNI